MPWSPFRCLMLACAGLALALAAVRADISPSRYTGYGITPVAAQGLRMVSANVTIDWGTPCVLSATFVVENQTPKPVDVPLGFPVLGMSVMDGRLFSEFPRPSRTNAALVAPNELIFAFDGVPVAPSAITIDAQSTNHPEGSVWYRCLHTFQSGLTKVTVITRLPASRDEHFPYQEHLYYCIETGGSWEGTIGSENVTVRFPSPVLPGQIVEGSPANFTIEGSTVNWRFKDFKPKGQDHDIAIAYLRPDIASILARMRAEYAHDPTNPARILRLARNLFALGPDRGYAAYPPDDLTPAEFNDLLVTINNDQDHMLFQSCYVLNAEGNYHIKESSWPADATAMLRILNAADYQPAYWRSPYVDEAKALVEKLLAAQPANAAAWNVYFANYYRFSFAGGGRQGGEWIYYPHEIAQIQKAIALCPQDPILQLWYKVITHPPRVGGDSSALDDFYILQAKLEKQGVIGNDYPRIKYDYD